MRRLALVTLLAAAPVFVAACGSGGAEQASAPEQATSTAAGAGNTTGAPSPATVSGNDPRKNGFEVALGEWALTPEAGAIRPGRTVFVVTNRGTMPHGFEIEREDGDDSSGSGSGDDQDKLETRILQPGESVEVELKLSEGVYKLECNVEGHDDMGMEMLLEVSGDAPLAAKPAAGSSKSAAVAIEAFAFAPPTITAQVGQEITWENHDPADHTVTGEDGSFDSGTMAKGATFKASFDSPGEYRYICELHPGMKGKVVVKG
jgi:plastocyanin